MTRIFLDDSRVSGDSATVGGSDAHHLLNVLRMSVGDSFIVVDERGVEREATIAEVGADRLQVQLGEACRRPVEPSVSLTIYHGLPRASRYETSLRMCTEIGVARFAPVLSAKSVIRLSGSAVERKQDRWQRIVEEAAKQCGRTQIPEVAAPMSWEDALEHFCDARGAGIMPSAGLAGSDAPSLGELCARLAEEGERQIAIFIGPESGFDLAEEADAREAGVTLVTMGPRILRTETAAVVAAAICLDRAGEQS